MNPRSRSFVLCTLSLSALLSINAVAQTLDGPSLKFSCAIPDKKFVQEAIKADLEPKVAAACEGCSKIKLKIKVSAGSPVYNGTAALSEVMDSSLLSVSASAPVGTIPVATGILSSPAAAATPPASPPLDIGVTFPDTADSFGAIGGICETPLDVKIKLSYVSNGQKRKKEITGKLRVVGTPKFSK